MGNKNSCVPNEARQYEGMIELGFYLFVKIDFCLQVRIGVYKH